MLNYFLFLLQKANKRLGFNLLNSFSCPGEKGVKVFDFYQFVKSRCQVRGGKPTLSLEKVEKGALGAHCSSASREFFVALREPSEMLLGFFVLFSLFLWVVSLLFFGWLGLFCFFFPWVSFFFLGGRAVLMFLFVAF